MRVILCILLTVSMVGCTADSQEAEGLPRSAKNKAQPKSSSEPKQEGAAEKNLPAKKTAPKQVSKPSSDVGQQAPAFTLTSYEGGQISLSAHSGKVVVLEWYNPDCPFVKYAYNEGPMKKLIAESVAKGVVWLGINSGAPGNQGHGAETNLRSKKAWGLSHAILEDADGSVGRLYGATRTPEVVVVGKNGKIAYRGALDTSRGAKPDPEDAYTNYTANAIAAVLAGDAVSAPTSTPPWGCTVKYKR